MLRWGDKREKRREERREVDCKLKLYKRDK
jgi:hypothetical protein